MTFAYFQQDGTKPSCTEALKMAHTGTESLSQKSESNKCELKHPFKTSYPELMHLRLAKAAADMSCFQEHGRCR
jgi:hypothetical protein